MECRSLKQVAACALFICLIPAIVWLLQSQVRQHLGTALSSSRQSDQGSEASAANSNIQPQHISQQTIEELLRRASQNSERPTSGSTTAPSSINLSQSSFQNPFQAGYWIANGWTFAEDFMQSNNDSIAVARFRHAYQGLGIEFQLIPENESVHFELRLGSNTRTTAVVEFTKNTVAVTAEIDSRPYLVEQRPLTAPFEAGGTYPFRITATGSRLLVFSNRKRLLMCDQPGDDGAAVYPYLVAHSGNCRLVQLRIDGE